MARLWCLDHRALVRETTIEQRVSARKCSALLPTLFNLSQHKRTEPDTDFNTAKAETRSFEHTTSAIATAYLNGDLYAWPREPYFARVPLRGRNNDGFSLASAIFADSSLYAAF